MCLIIFWSSPTANIYTMMLWLIYISLFMVIAAAFPFLNAHVRQIWFQRKCIEAWRIIFNFIAIVDGDRRRKTGAVWTYIFAGLLFWLSWAERERSPMRSAVPKVHHCNIMMIIFCFLIYIYFSCCGSQRTRLENVFYSIYGVSWYFFCSYHRVLLSFSPKVKNKTKQF